MAKMTMLKPALRAADLRAVKPPPKVVDDHYSSPEHREWRRQVIARAGGRCQGKDCGRSGARLFADHIVERRDGGALLDPANGRALCGSCHTAKTMRERAKRAMAQAGRAAHPG